MANSKNIIYTHTGVYFLGDILRRSVSLIMLPIYTRYLTPGDYGTVELLSMLIDFASIIFGARMAESIFRFYCTATSEKEKNNVISSALVLDTTLSSIGAFIIVISSSSLSTAIFSKSGFETYISLFAITMALLPLTEIPMIYIRAQRRPWLFFALSTLKLFVQLALNIYFVVVKDMHVSGVVYSAVISSAFMSLILVPYILHKVGIKATRATCIKLVSFSFPMKLATFGSFYLTFGDRYFLNIFTDLTQVGIYSLGYKFGFIFTLIAWTPFERMWDAEKYAISARPDAIQFLQKVFVGISMVMIFIGLMMALFTKDLLKVMSDPAFLGAYEIAPIIILAYIFQAWTKFCDLGLLLEEKTSQIAYAELIAVIVITFAYLFLIPRYGTHGAAWATVAGFAARLFWVNKKGKQYLNMRLPWARIWMAGCLAVLAYLLSLAIPNDLLTSILVRIILALCFTASLLLLPVFTRDEKREMSIQLRSLVNILLTSARTRP